MVDWSRLLPSYWIQNYPTNMFWDRFVAEAISRGEVEAESPCRAKVGGVSVWVGNWPYAYGYPYNVPGLSEVMPTVATRKRLRDMLMSKALGLLTPDISGDAHGED